MTPWLRAGLARGGIELRQTLTNGMDLWGYTFPAIVLVVTLFFMRDASVPGMPLSLGSTVLPGALGMGVAYGGLLAVAQNLVVEREDGTLLRAKATPNGMQGYLIGKIVLVGGMTLLGMVVQLAAGLLLVDEVRLDAAGWLTLLWVVPLGLVATMPIGAVIGSLFDNARNLGLVMLPVIGLIAVSGIFYPLTALPGWLQAVGQAFPVFWLGHGFRAAFLPDAFAAAEPAGSWQLLTTFGVLAAWSAAGLLIAPRILRRMARRESGSAVAARRERAMTQRAV